VFYAVMKALALAALRLLFRHRAIGVEHVPLTGGALLASNHMSHLDPPVVGVGAPRPLHFMAKAELFRIPLFGGMIRRLNAYPVEREGADASALRHALLLLRRGEALLVFPEGTRGTEGGPLGQGRAGTGMLAALAGVPVVPVYVEGTGRALPRGAGRPRLTRITVRYGPPLVFDRGKRGDRDRGKQRYQEISDQIMAAIGRLRAEAEQASPAASPAPAVNVNR
jgi:1-acyl-sn-glycerol-3-phosphate acyltransferase